MNRLLRASSWRCVRGPFRRDPAPGRGKSGLLTLIRFRGEGQPSPQVGMFVVV